MGAKRLGIISASILFGMGFWPSLIWSVDNNPYSCFYTSDTIRIDARLDEPAWRKAPVLDFFIPPHAGKPLSKTKGRLLWNAKFLYVGFLAYDKDIRGSFTKRDSPTFKEDVLEFFFKPIEDDERYYNLEINALGTVYDAVNAKHIPWRKRPLWNCHELQVKIMVEGTMNQSDDQDRYWMMELALPWSDLDILKGKPPGHGGKWRFHLARYDYSRYLPEGRELSSTAPLSRVAFHHHPDWPMLEFLP